MQSIISRPLADVIENFGFAPVCFTFAVLPIAGYSLVHVLIRNESSTDPAADQSQVIVKITSTR
jgi:hypothetical protein